MMLANSSDMAELEHHMQEIEHYVQEDDWMGIINNYMIIEESIENNHESSKALKLLGVPSNQLQNMFQNDSFTNSKAFKWMGIENTVEVISIQGHLEKQTSNKFIKKWKPRFFVLHRNILNSYKSEEQDNKTSEQFVIDPQTKLCMLSNTGSHGNSGKFQISLQNQQEHWLLMTANIDDASKWYKELRKVINTESCNFILDNSHSQLGRGLQSSSSQATLCTANSNERFRKPSGFSYMNTIHDTPSLTAVHSSPESMKGSHSVDTITDVMPAYTPLFTSSDTTKDSFNINNGKFSPLPIFTSSPLLKSPDRLMMYPFSMSQQQSQNPINLMSSSPTFNITLTMLENLKVQAI